MSGDYEKLRAEAYATRTSNMGLGVVEKPPILIGEKVYVFSTNISFDSRKASKCPNGYLRAKNSCGVYFDLARRGMAVVPEDPATDMYGGRINGDTFAFYPLSDLVGDCHKIVRGLTDEFPHVFSPVVSEHTSAEELQQYEIASLVDVAIEEMGLTGKLEELGLV